MARIRPLHARRAPRVGSSLTLSDLYLCAACRLLRAASMLMPSPALCYRPCAEESLAWSHRVLVSLQREGLLVYEGKVIEMARLFAPSPLAREGAKRLLRRRRRAKVGMGV